MEDLLSPSELVLIQKLGSCWNDFLAIGKLSGRHPSDRDEFLRAIHAAQSAVMVRAARRAYPAFFLSSTVEKRGS